METGTVSKASSLSLIDQVRYDLSVYIDKYPNKSFAIQVISKESGLSEKTLKRILAKSNKPTYQTLFKLYSVFFGSNDYKNLIKNAPSSVSDMLKNCSPVKVVCQDHKNKEFLDFIKSDKLISEFFVLAATGTLNKSSVGYKYGQYGLNALSQLEESGFIIRIDNSSYEMSKNVPNLDAEALKYLGATFTERFLKLSNSQVEGENTVSFYAEGLNEEGLNEWLKIDSESFYRKQKIANNKKYQGSKPVFTFNVTDTVD